MISMRLLAAYSLAILNFSLNFMFAGKTSSQRLRGCPIYAGNRHPEIGGHQLLFTFLLPRESPVCVHIVPLSPCLHPLSSAGLDPALSQHVAVQFPGPDCPATKMDY